MTSRQLVAVVICVCVTLTRAEDKWVWSKERKTDLVQTDSTKVSVAKPILNDASPSESSRKIDDQISRLFDDSDDYRKARYEVQETIDYVNGRPVSPRPKPYIRPIPNRPIPNEIGYPDRPQYPDRLPPQLIPDRYPPPPPGPTRYPPPPPPLPDRFPPPNNRFPPPIPDGPDEPIVGNSQTPVRREPPPASVGILTGPVPSWEKPVLHKNGDPTNFEHCKCSFSFNCKSPGIQFGSCDQGKTYCCYNEFNADKNAPAQQAGFGSSNIERYDKAPPILIGPGGPAGPGRPPVDYREVKPLLPANPPRRPDYQGYRPYAPSYEEVNDDLDSFDYGRRPQLPIIPQKPILPPYMGLHNDYRSS